MVRPADRSDQFAESHEALLAHGDSIPLRTSVDDDGSFTTDSEDGTVLIQAKQPLAKSRRRRPGPAAVAAKGSPTPKFSSCLSPSRRCLIITGILVFGLLSLLGAGGFWLYKNAPTDGHSPPWYPSPQGGTAKSWQDSYEKAQKLVEQMSIVEKVNITTGVGWQMEMCVGNTAPADSAGFPGLCLQDGPLGIRFADNSTAFPAGVTTGATWNRDLMRRRGAAHGREARLKGVNVLLGPSMGALGRMPAGGRVWEGFGSDPVLQAVAAAETIKGIQSEGVMATAKHYVANEQEHFRQSWEWGLPNAMSTNIDDRTLHEIYTWPFAESVRAGVASVMCSYQMVNNSYACGNSKLMNGILKDEYGFQGFVQSDWLAQRSGVASALAGLDMSMPGDGLFWADGKSLWGKHLTLAALNGSLPMDRLNDMVTRIVSSWYQLGQDSWPKPPPEGDGGPNFSSWTNDEVGLLHPGSDDNSTGVVNKFVDVQGKGDSRHALLARQVAAEGTVLVKNEDGILPLARTDLSARQKNPGLRIGIFGEDAGPGKGANACKDRGCNQGTLASGWGSGAVEFPYLVTPWEALKSAFADIGVETTGYLDNAISDQLSQDLKKSDLCLAFANADAGEGKMSSEGARGDRDNLFLQKNGDELIETVVHGCGNGTGETIVVIHAVGPVIMERWIDNPKVKAVLLANLPGQESGNSLVDVLFGDVDASGRLSYTVGKSLEDYGPGGQILYYPNAPIPQQDFTEGLYIDYRHFDREGVEPRFEFGFGLSYTSFEFTDLKITMVKPKTALPSPRPDQVQPPAYDNKVPDPSTALFPAGFRKLKKYVYPYINSVTEVKSGKYPYPVGWDQHPVPSDAGGAPGGNPSLFETVATVSLRLVNTGARAGQEVVQLYLSFPENTIDPASGEAIDFPVRVLRSFKKIGLRAGESQSIAMELTRKDLSYWSVVQQNWVMPTAGEFTVSVGRSSRDIPLTGTF